MTFDHDAGRLGERSRARAERLHTRVGPRVGRGRRGPRTGNPEP